MQVRKSELAPSNNELKRLAAMANDGYLLGWLVDLRESLDDKAEKIVKTYARLDELKQWVAHGQPKMTEDERCELASSLRRVIAFNNKSAREKATFDAVGLGSCCDELDMCASEVRNALSLAAKRSNR